MSGTSRSPSPAQPPPTPSAPGPRATALQKLYADAIAHILRTCSYANFASCFPTAAARVPSSVADLHRQFITHLGASLAQNFEVILEERKVVQSLNELDRLIDDARKRKANNTTDNSGPSDHNSLPVPPHTLPAQKLYLTHLAPTLDHYAAEMGAQQEALDAENNALLERVQQQRRQIQFSIDGLEKVVGDLQGSVQALQPEQLDALREQCREADEALR